MKTSDHRLGTRASSIPIALAMVVCAIALGTTSVAQARIVRLDIVRTESATFGGTSFAAAGTYDKIVARAHGELNPADPHNAIITDINLAPRNANGMVEYATDVYILKPTNLAKGSGKIFYDVVNRGSKLSLADFNGIGPNDPTTAADAGTGLLMRMGYSIVWSGWEDPSVIGTSGLSASLPIAMNPDGSHITGQTIFEQIFDSPTGDTYTLLYKAATTDQATATMYVRNSSSGPRAVVPTTVWSYVDNQHVKINRTDPFLANYDNGAAYELVYTAIDPIVLGIGFAATRDVLSFLHYDTSTANPLSGGIQWVLGRGDSQSGRYIKGFIHLGFNADESARIVFHGVNPHISGAHDIASNDRWGDGNATGRKYQRHTIAKQEFPFTYEVRTDPISGKTDGIFVRCQPTGTCPKVIHTDSGNEPYLKPTVLVTSDGVGHDITLPSNVRLYDVGSTQHGPSAVPSLGICQQLSNPNEWAPYIRALFVALDLWTTAGVEPPPSAYARISDGTAVPTPQAFPNIPGVTYTGWINPVAVLDKSHLPYMPIPGTDYMVFAPKVDADGNDIPGVRTIDVQVPLATYTGWGLRRTGFAPNEDCGLQGQYIPFQLTKDARIAAGDPRLSVQERYGSFSGYYFSLLFAISNTVGQRFLLAEDAPRLFNAGLVKAFKSGLQPKVEELDALFSD
jgi:hypothetical protein